MNRLFKILFAIEFILILMVIALILIENNQKQIPTAYAVKENSSIEKTDLKIFTKAVCEEKSEHIFCRDVLFVKCDDKEYISSEENLKNFCHVNKNYLQY